MKKVELPIEEIVEKYKNGTNTEKIATEYGVSKRTINRRLDEYYEKNGIKRPTLKKEGRKKMELPLEEIVKKYENKINLEKLATEYGVSTITINKRLNEYYEMNGIQRPTFKKEGRKKIELPIEEIAKKYEDGIRVEDLATEYGVSYFTINNRLKKYYEMNGIQRPTFKKEGRKKIELPIEEIAKKYEDGIRVEDLATEYSVSKTTINVRLRQYYEEKKLKRSFIKEYYKKIELPIEEIVEKYENGISTKKLATEYSVSKTTINVRLRRYYEEKQLERPVINECHKKVELPIEEIVEKYENGISTKKLATEYGVSTITINKRLNEYYEKNGIQRPNIKKAHTKNVIQRPSTKREDKKLELPIEEIVEKYEKGINATSLAIEYHVAYGRINTILNEYYKSKGKKLPRILRSSSVIEEYLKRGLTMEAIINIASKRNVIIPQDIINTIINNKSINDDDQR